MKRDEYELLSHARSCSLFTKLMYEILCSCGPRPRLARRTKGAGRVQQKISDLLMSFGRIFGHEGCSLDQCTTLLAGMDTGRGFKVKRTQHSMARIQRHAYGLQLHTRSTSPLCEGRLVSACLYVSASSCCWGTRG